MGNKIGNLGHLIPETLYLTFAFGVMSDKWQQITDAFMPIAFEMALFMDSHFNLSASSSSLPV
jgi:hypothetical protein